MYFGLYSLIIGGFILIVAIILFIYKRSKQRLCDMDDNEDRNFLQTILYILESIL